MDTGILVVVIIVSRTIFAIIAVHTVIMEKIVASVTVGIVVITAGLADVIIAALNKMRFCPRKEPPAIVTLNITLSSASIANSLFPALNPVSFLYWNNIVAVVTDTVMLHKAIMANRISLGIIFRFVLIIPVATVVASHIATLDGAIFITGNGTVRKFDRVTVYGFATMVTVLDHIRGYGRGGAAAGSQGLCHGDSFFWLCKKKCPVVRVAQPGMRWGNEGESGIYRKNRFRSNLPQSLALQRRRCNALKA